MLKREAPLFDSKEALQDIEDFFKTKVQIFDAAAQMEADLRNELDYLSHEPEANEALKKIRTVVLTQGGFSYKKVPELNELMATVQKGHNRLLDVKREEVGDIITQCMGAVHEAGRGDLKARDIIMKADEYFTQKRQQVKELNSLALLDGLIPPMLQYKDATVEKLERLFTPPVPPKPPVPVTGSEGGNGQSSTTSPQPMKIIKPYNRQIIFPAKRLESEADIDAYVEKIRDQLKQLLKNCDGIQLK